MYSRSDWYISLTKRAFVRVATIFLTAKGSYMSDDVLREPCSKEMLESMDVLIYDLVTDPQYKLPQIAPDGVYSPESD